MNLRRMLEVLWSTTKEARPLVEGYAGTQFVGIDLHRRRSVIVRMTGAGQVLEAVRIHNDVERLTEVMARAGGGAGGGPGGNVRVVLGR